jgi:2-(1,2-epoxy-1,2-dihydrophenyl)acetyl-CoA isomerase
MHLSESKGRCNVVQSETRDLVEYTVSDGLATITLNRPERRNALTRDMLIRLRDVVLQSAGDDAVRAVLLTGNGKGFCAGQDLGERDPRKLDGPLDLEAIQHEFYHPLVIALASMEKPVVVAVNGIAAGAGSSIALAGDIVLAARSARFIQSFVKVGLSVDAGGAWHLVRALGPARARALLMTGGEMTAEEAERAGLIWQCVDDETLQDAAHDLARKLAEGPRTAIASIKKAVAAASAAGGFADYLKTEAALQGRTGRDPDYREGVLAFIEKRTPRYGG